MAGVITINKPLHKGDLVKCQGCGDKHPVRLSKDNEGHETDMLMYITCPKNKASYVVGVDGYKILAGKAKEALERIKKAIAANEQCDPKDVEWIE